jgi:hypothetical protein
VINSASPRSNKMRITSQKGGKYTTIAAAALSLSLFIYSVVAYLPPASPTLMTGRGDPMIRPKRQTKIARNWRPNPTFLQTRLLRRRQLAQFAPFFTDDNLSSYGLDPHKSDGADLRGHPSFSSDVPQEKK